MPHAVKSGHAIEGFTMTVAISVWIPKSAFKLVSYSVVSEATQFRSRYLRFIDKESPELGVYEHRNQIMRADIYNIPQNSQNKMC